MAAMSHEQHSLYLIKYKYQVISFCLGVEHALRFSCFSIEGSRTDEIIREMDKELKSAGGL